ncbi:HypC/HybG/HupF family hydrogenase formation chaperone [Terasakiella sp. SH-1]|uniref:HypC/HybG/HupF family hydrogenase formation chaperone n=1 Tax=Terasakiella sp. SH-1 TaxID=2560057 RepID=UPI0010732F03|nr:HypC/HybG/HupF family hydrogenase formation chaperone [Terasakiella sp. SH-1]
MCLAIPVEVISTDPEKDTAMVSLDGIKKEISVALIDDVQVGDYVLLHVGYAINKISPQEAEKTLELMAESGLLAPSVQEQLS